MTATGQQPGYIAPSVFPPMLPALPMLPAADRKQLGDSLDYGKNECLKKCHLDSRLLEDPCSQHQGILYYSFTILQNRPAAGSQGFFFFVGKVRK
jgi:hypothetical protein